MEYSYSTATIPTASGESNHQTQNITSKGSSWMYSKNEELNSALIGRRVCVEMEEYRGTVRYVGPIPNSKGTWLGIDWDDEERGRHNGNHAGTQYFITSKPTSGSFVRPNKVTFGISFETGVENRYGASRNDIFTSCFNNAAKVVNSVCEEADLVDEYCTGGSTFAIELMGPAGKTEAYDFKKLRSCQLQNTYIVASEGKMAGLLPAVRELSLARTLLSKWSEVAEICRQLPSLEFLTLSDNKIPPLSANEDDLNLISNMKVAFSKVNHLIIVRLGYTWREMEHLLSVAFPKLNKLCVAYNNLLHIQPSPVLNSLTYIDLAGNGISDFLEDVMTPIGQLSNLQTLLLSDNKIVTVAFPGPIHQKTDFFPSLKTLCLGNNKISDWTTINQINRLSALSEFLIYDNPILNNLKIDEIRVEIIGRMANLTVLNRSDVDAKERKICERDYIKAHGITYLELVNAKDTEKIGKFHELNPRYKALTDKHGAPEENELQKSTPALKQGLITVSIQCPSVSGEAITTKKLPGRMIVNHLTALTRRLYRIPGGAPVSLYFTTQRNPGRRYPLDSETRELTFYHIDSGDTLIVDVLSSSVAKSSSVSDALEKSVPRQNPDNSTLNTNPVICNKKLDFENNIVNTDTDNSKPNPDLDKSTLNVDAENSKPNPVPDDSKSTVDNNNTASNNCPENCSPNLREENNCASSVNIDSCPIHSLEHNINNIFHLNYQRSPSNL